MKSADVKKVKGISKNQWLAKALELLESSGFEAVKVEQLAKLLGTSRSGFYWHFKNRKDLLQHLLNYWAQEYTSILIDDQDMINLPAGRRLLAAMKMIRNENLTKYDLAMIAWAKVDPQVHAAVRKVIQMRLDFSREIFVKLGFTGDELEMRVQLFTCYHTWENTTFSTEDEEQYLRQQELRYQMFIN